MSKQGYKVTGCLWFFLETVCLAVFVILIAVKLCGTPITWLSVFVPVFVGFALAIALLLVLFITTFTDEKYGEG